MFKCHDLRAKGVGVEEVPLVSFPVTPRNNTGMRVLDSFCSPPQLNSATHGLFSIWQHEHICFASQQKIFFPTLAVRLTQKTLACVYYSVVCSFVWGLGLNTLMPGPAEHLFPHGSKKKMTRTHPHTKVWSTAVPMHGCKSATKLCKWWNEYLMLYEHGKHVPRLF